jgi:hypothetical protein
MQPDGDIDILVLVGESVSNIWEIVQLLYREVIYAA